MPGLWSILFYGVLVLFQFAVLRAVGSSITLVDAALVAPLVPLVSLAARSPPMGWA